MTMVKTSNSIMAFTEYVVGRVVDKTISWGKELDLCSNDMSIHDKGTIWKNEDLVCPWQKYFTKNGRKLENTKKIGTISEHNSKSRCVEPLAL